MVVHLFHKNLWPFAVFTCLLTVPLAGCANAEENVAGNPAIVEATPSQSVLASLHRADVVYLGETHDSAADHATQLEIIQQLYAENPDLAIGMEMFQRPFQPVIDRYLAGDISEADLVIQTEYQERWGFPWEFYAPILRFAQAHQIPVLALNTPQEITRQVAQEGLESLEANDFRYIPPLQAIDLGNEGYREFVASAFSAHGNHGNLNFENFFAAQVLWDETMAETIATFKQSSPETQVIVLAGSGHVIYGYGIPSRVERRLGSDTNQVRVLLNFPVGSLTQNSRDVADILWYNTSQ
jgi:uncharacterized iron-regulated protein